MSEIHILNTRTRCNMIDDTPDYSDFDSVGYVLRNVDTGATRVALSAGDLGDEFELGTTHTMYSYGTEKKIGVGEVIGVVTFTPDDEGNWVTVWTGETVNRSIPVYVFK